jgi:hypothetical protein
MVLEIQRAPEAVDDHLRVGARFDQQLGAGRVAVLAGVVQRLTDGVVQARVVRVSTRGEKRLGQCAVAGDPRGAVDRRLRPVAMHERCVWIGARSQ